MRRVEFFLLGCALVASLFVYVHCDAALDNTAFEVSADGSVSTGSSQGSLSGSEDAHAHELAHREHVDHDHHHDCDGHGHAHHHTEVRYTLRLP
jgi:hypothetical protein